MNLNDRRGSGQCPNIKNVEHTGVVERGGGQEMAAGLRDRLGVVAIVGGISVATEDGEQVGRAAGRGEAGAVVGDRGRGGTTKEFLPPGSAVGAAGLRGGGVDAEGLKEDVQPAFVLVSTFAPEPEEEEEEVREEGFGPEQDGEPNVSLGA